MTSKNSTADLFANESNGLNMLQLSAGAGLGTFLLGPSVAAVATVTADRIAATFGSPLSDTNKVVVALGSVVSAVTVTTAIYALNPKLAHKAAKFAATGAIIGIASAPVTATVGVAAYALVSDALNHTTTNEGATLSQMSGTIGFGLLAALALRQLRKSL